ncbi:DUF397 domain-containing protein [Streptomyces sp. NRRL F-2799]|uniref:DUF397 domain-containing protein n=1 Tax=Streptomyces sp. NRRL F-2799 TaxID=1463844 RepID=UPI0004C77732|nr:DUF397 domain-containing protein [Streptomyces sp. NRRL F-2799]
MTNTPHWFKSSYSNNGGNCVEVATNLLPAHGIIPVRDSKHRAGSVLELRAATFSSFVTGVKNGLFCRR